MILQDVLGLIFNQLTGFLLWVVVTPARLLIALFDPVFGPLVSTFNLSAFVQGFENLRGFFTDVNYFVPFFAAVSIIRATIDVALLYGLFRMFGGVSIHGFMRIVLDVLSWMVQEIKERARDLLTRILLFFFGSRGA